MEKLIKVKLQIKFLHFCNASFPLSIFGTLIFRMWQHFAYNKVPMFTCICHFTGGVKPR